MNIPLKYDFIKCNTFQTKCNMLEKKHAKTNMVVKMKH